MISLMKIQFKENMEIVLGGRYQLYLQRIGSGAFGQIYQGKKALIYRVFREMLKDWRANRHQNGMR